MSSSIAIMVKFSSIEKINELYDSDEYHPLKALQDEGADEGSRLRRFEQHTIELLLTTNTHGAKAS
jgi:hypothetical protein